MILPDLIWQSREVSHAIKSGGKFEVQTFKMNFRFVVLFLTKTMLHSFWSLNAWLSVMDRSSTISGGRLHVLMFGYTTDLYVPATSHKPQALIFFFFFWGGSRPQALLSVSSLNSVAPCDNLGNGPRIIAHV